MEVPPEELMEELTEGMESIIANRFRQYQQQRDFPLRRYISPPAGFSQKNFVGLFSLPEIQVPYLMRYHDIIDGSRNTTEKSPDIIDVSLPAGMFSPRIETIFRHFSWADIPVQNPISIIGPVLHSMGYWNNLRLDKIRNFKDVSPHVDILSATPHTDQIRSIYEDLITKKKKSVTEAVAFGHHRQIDQIIKFMPDNQARSSIQYRNIIKTRPTRDDLITEKKSVTEAVAFGHHRQREQIIKFMLDNQAPGSNNCSVVAIIGEEGAGKTSLAKSVYNNERVKKHFDLRMEIRLSPNLDIKEVTREMIMEATKKECPNISNLNVLQNKLLEALAQYKNIMVVLYNVHSDDKDKAAEEQKWSGLLAPFTLREETCKIMVTSCSTLFPSALLPTKLINFSDLANQSE